MDRHSGGGPPPHLKGRPVTGLEAAHANEYFEPFLNATTLKNILGYHRSMCEFLHLKSNVFPQFYPKLRANLTSWRAKALWKKFDARASHKCYGKGKTCAGTRVLVIGGGPCGLRTAIEAQMLGAKVVLVEKRDRLSRNNVLHLWPFVIEDLRMLGAKKFFGKFCAGSIDHISIRQIQCILFKVALLLGVEVHTEVSFEGLIEPCATEKTGWRAEIKPETHPVSQYEFDVIIGADGKRNTLQGFKRKEFRGKLAIAITANFINKKTEAEARVEEISGVAFIFNQKFFKDLQGETRIDLENIVYYKDDTHYFVMTAKKASLLEKGVIKQDLADTEKLLAPDNVNRDALQSYAREAADFSTNYQLPNLEFAVNHYGQPDVAMFDFTSMYAAEYASKVIERNGSRLLKILVGDSLLEPFWPTGSGCARGFLSSLDAAWAIRSWSSGQMTPLDVLAERESIYRLLAQTTPDNLNKDWKSYTLDPSTRYPNLNKTVVTPHQTVCLYDTDNPDGIDRMKRASLEAASRQDHVAKKRRRGIVDKEALLNWLREQLCNHEDITITNIASVFRDGKPLCAIIHHYRPDLLDYGAIKNNEPAMCNQLAMDVLEKELGIPPFMTGEEITNTEDYLAMATYLTQVYDTFRGEIPHIKHPKLRVRSPTKIPKIIPKNLSTPQTLNCQPELFTKLNIIERKLNQTTASSISNSKSFIGTRLEKGGGDCVVSEEKKKCQEPKKIPNEEMTTRNKEFDIKEKKHKKISSDDLEMVTGNAKLMKTVKKRTPIETRPVKTLSEKTFLTASIESFKNIKRRKSSGNPNKIEFFDLTYADDSSRQNRIKSPQLTLGNNAVERNRGDESVKKIKRKSSLDVTSEDKVLKKAKSRNVSISVNMIDRKTVKKKKLKLKKSKLSIIPESKEDKLSEKKKTLSPTKNKASSSMEENSFGPSSVENKKITIIEDTKKFFLEKAESNTTVLIDASGEYKNISEKRNIKRKEKSLKILRCETFIQSSFEGLNLPYLEDSTNKRESNNENLVTILDKTAKNYQKGSEENQFSSFIANAENKKTENINSTRNRSLGDEVDKSKTAIEGNRFKPRNVKNKLGLKYFSPLQVIRKHLSIKKTQLKFVLSRSNEALSDPTKNLYDDVVNEIVPGPIEETHLTDSNIDDNDKRIISKDNTDATKSQDSSAPSINIQIIHKSSKHKITCQGVEYKSSLNLVKIAPRTCLSTHYNRRSRNLSFNNTNKRDGYSQVRNFKMPSKVTSTNKNVNDNSGSYKSVSDNQYRKTANANGVKKVEQIFENKENFLKDNFSSQFSVRGPKLEKRRFPDFGNPQAARLRRSKTFISIKEKPALTPVDAQIINALGTFVIDTSNLKKICQQKSRNNKDCHKEKKFLLENGLRNNNLEKSKLLYENRIEQLKLCTDKPKFKKHFGETQKGLIKMELFDDDDTLPPQIYTRVQKWISQHDFKADEVKKDPEGETLFTCDVTSDITSVTRAHAKKKGEYDDIKVEERTDVVKCASPISSSQEDFVELVKHLKDGKTVPLKDSKTTVKPASKFSQFNMKSVSAPPANFSVIVEGEESELPESNKRSEFSFKSIRTTNHQPSIFNVQQSRPSSRHKRHAEVMVPKPCSIDRKQRKRRTLERIGPSVEERQKVIEEISANRQDRQNKRKQQRQRQTKQFIKSMQMLQANAKPDRSEPFEDYSIFLYRQTAPKFEDRVKDLEKQFTYVPDHDRVTGLKPLANTNAEEDIASKIKSLEDKWSNQQPTEKKPKDLLRAIGKIETSDWNIKQIEKKILENKVGKPSTLNADKERVPRWSREEFRARQTKMEKKHLDRQDSSEAKYADIDKNIKELDLKLKEGTARELGQNKVASITEKLVTKIPPEKKPIEKPAQPKPVNLPTQSGSEFCHFCTKRVYLMERLSAESRFFHHGCFKCQYCHTQLRLGSYMFDRDGQYGHRFFCMHHYGMQGELPRPTKVVRKQSQKGAREAGRSPQKKSLSGVAGVDLLDRVQTPERIEFSNLSAGNISSDHEEPLSQMDEDEWTDKNFGASCNELDESEDSSSSLSDTDSDDEDAFDDALEEPVTKEGTMKWAERWKNSYRKGRHSNSDGYSSSDHSSYYENSSDDSDSDTATEGEDEIRARELRKQEVRVEPPVVQTDTGTDTEMVSEESSKSSSEIHNSATEISTDSEFAQDEPTPTREVPSIALNDFHVTKTRGTGKSNYPKKIQVTSGYIRRPTNENSKSKPHIELKLSPLVPSTPDFKKPAPVLLPRTEGYALNRTQSTGGIAAKVSLELKKRYLLGESGTNGIQKSGSASTLDTKFKSFQNTISDCQKLLKPAPEVSASMQMFCSKLDERHSPVLSPHNSFVLPGINNKLIEDKNKQQELPPPDITITTINENKDEKSQDHESESRPRSPVHEASIPVPSIDWSKHSLSQSSDSLSMSSSASEHEVPKAPNFNFENIPRVEVHEANDSDKEDIPLDSLSPEIQKDDAKMEALSEKSSSSIIQEQCKSITSEKKMLNQPKSLPNLESVLPEIHKALHIKIRSDKEESPEEAKSIKTVSGKSSPDATAALTETELSDWARDENVSDSIELDMSQGSEKKKVIKIANISEFEEAINHHVCGKSSKDAANKIILTESMTNALSTNLDNIEYMDTGTETSSDDGVVDSQNGYVLFKNEDDIAEDSLNPHINEIFEAKNIYLTKKEAEGNCYLLRNTGYCEVARESNNFGGEVIDLKPADLERLKQKQTLTDHEEDSLLILETGTTTEENTCSDSTVKNITELIADTKEVKDKPSLKIENLQKQRLEDKLAKVKAERALLNEQKEASEKENIESNLQFEEHCQRLQSKVEFGNARDSIDIRKSRRKSKTDSPQKPDLIQEEKEIISPPRGITLNLSPVSPADMLYKKENIKKERDVNKKLIEEMVMNKMKAENKSLERKKRNRGNISSLSPCKPYEIQKSNTTDIVSQININNLDKSAKHVSPNSDASSIYTTPDLLSNSIPPRNIQTTRNVSDVNSSTEIYSTPAAMFTPKQNSSRPLSVFSTFTDIRKLPETPLTNPENFSLPDIRKKLFNEDFKTPKPPPRYNRPSDVAKTAEKMKESARARARLLSNEDLGLSPEDKLNKLRERMGRRGKENEVLDVHIQESIESLVLNTDRRNSQLYSNDTLTKKKNNYFKRSKSGESEINLNLSGSNISVGVRPKSVSEIPKNLSVSKSTGIKANENRKIFKSDPNLLDTNYAQPKKKSKDRERRKSITKLIVGIFTKKSPTGNGTKGLFAKLSPKSKAISKDIVTEAPIKKKSNSEISILKREPTPPPIPPLPVNYTMKATDESSDGEILDHKHQGQSSCDTLDQSANFETSMSSLTGRRSGKARRVSRQAQLKRHRMAQEIQRKLEETEVKTRELEHRGVEVEKALRGEDNRESLKDESDLLQEWFDLMRDRSELRRYEKELMVRAQELELEDRHSRLQADLRERLETNESKTEEDLKTEESIINEMMEIVAKRDSLIALLEEDRLRYAHEDKDLEEQMLAKGLMLTPIQKSPEN